MKNKNSQMRYDRIPDQTPRALESFLPPAFSIRPIVKKNKIEITKKLDPHFFGHRHRHDVISTMQKSS
jgi:hypothetical protein